MFVLIIDYGSGNIKSVYNSVKRTLHKFNKLSELKVSRNLSEIKKADKIIVMNNHKIENIGSHKLLIKKSKTYRELHKLQSL